MSNEINMLKVAAMILVYFCHCYIVCNHTFGFEFENNWQMLLKTPAWAGVWIFVFVSGYLAENGFAKGKYKYQKESIIEYYKGRILKILIPSYIFISLAYILVTPSEPISLSFLVSLLTCTFNGKGGSAIVGASWYVFVVMWLYLITPFLSFAIDKIVVINKHLQMKRAFTVLCAVLLMGLCYRIFGRMAGLKWYDWIYANVFGCLDIFVVGMLANKLRGYFVKNNSVHKQRLYIFSLFALVILVNVSSICYFYGETTKPTLLSLYRYVFPSFYISLLFLLLSAMPDDKKQSNSWLKCGFSDGLGVFNTLADYSFMFYLWHTAILYSVARIITIGDLFVKYLVVLVMSFIITGYLSLLMTKMNGAIISSIKKL